MVPGDQPQEKSPEPVRKTTGAAAASDRKRKIAFAALTAGVLVAAGYFLWPAIKLSGLFTPAGIEVEVAISMSGFSPSRIEVREGTPLTIRLVNKDNRFHKDGGGWHQFAIDALGVNVKVPPLETRTFTVIPTKSGVFDFYCGVCCGGRANPYMHGALTVTT
jgi:cytochrome c oxidase subunit II